MGKYFGTDGIRGKAGAFLSAQLAFKVGSSLKPVLGTETLVIGKDTRESSDMLAYSLASGALSTGVTVLMAGVVTTPMVAYYSKEKKITGVMITASHNPFPDNGIKLFDEGYKLLEKDEARIEAFLDIETHDQGLGFGQLIYTEDIVALYKGLYQQLDLEPVNLSVGYDSANGANYKIAKDILKSLCDEQHQINGEPNGRNINAGCGSTHMEAIQSLIETKALDIGFSFDGDGDRVLVVDHAGNLYDGDLIIYALAKHLKSHDALKKNTVVLTKMSNPGVIKAFKNLGIKVIQTDVGDKYVTDAILKNGYTLGGENSGHIIMNHLLHTGDGLLVSVYLLKVLQSMKLPLKKYIEEVEMYPQRLVNIEQVNKAALDTPEVKQAIKTAQKNLGPDSLLLVRPSGTEPLIRVTVSHQDNDVLESTIQTLVETIEASGRDLEE